MKPYAKLYSFKYLKIFAGLAILLFVLLQLLVLTDLILTRPWSVRQAGFHSKVMEHNILDYKHYPLKKVNKLPKKCAKLNKYFSSIEQCLLQNALGEGISLWRHLNLAIQRCLASGVTANATRMRLDNKEDCKGFVPFHVSVGQNTSCTIVTLGVGNDTAAEQQMFQLNPNCQFFGVDPILEAGEIYRQVGIYDQIAVSADGGKVSSSVLRNGTYIFENLTSVSLLNYLQDYNISFIDNLLLDSEGPEYKLFPTFHRTGELAKAGITICQLNVEVHQFPDLYGFPKNQYDRLMTNFWLESPFWPLWSEVDGHNRYYFVNLEDQECIRRYFPQYCK